jgi:hypothetical protein
MTIYKSMELAGELLDAAVMAAAVGYSWEDDVPLPSENWGDCGPLMEHYGISPRPGLRWSAQFAHDENAASAFNEYRLAVCAHAGIGPAARDTMAHGSTACEAVCRCLVLCVLGTAVDL